MHVKVNFVQSRALSAAVYSRLGGGVIRRGKVQWTSAAGLCVLLCLSGPVASGQDGKKESLDVLRARAAKGDAKAEFELGRRYSAGEGVAQDCAEAARWGGEAADKGRAAAQLNLGSMCANGQGVTQDHAQAVRR